MYRIVEVHTAQTRRDETLAFLDAGISCKKTLFVLILNNNISPLSKSSTHLAKILTMLLRTLQRCDIKFSTNKLAHLILI